MSAIACSSFGKDSLPRTVGWKNISSRPDRRVFELLSKHFPLGIGLKRGEQFFERFNALFEYCDPGFQFRDGFVAIILIRLHEWRDAKDGDQSDADVTFHHAGMIPQGPCQMV